MWRRLHHCRRSKCWRWSTKEWQVTSWTSLDIRSVLDWSLCVRESCDGRLGLSDRSIILMIIRKVIECVMSSRVESLICLASSLRGEYEYLDTTGGCSPAVAVLLVDPA